MVWKALIFSISKFRYDEIQYLDFSYQRADFSDISVLLEPLRAILVEVIM